MDLLSNLDDSKWQSGQPDKITGLVDYTILKSKMLEPGRFEYALKENKEDGVLTIGIVEGCQGKRDALKSIRNVEMKLEAGKVIAINIDGDCVTRK